MNLNHFKEHFVNILEYLGRDGMATILQITFSNSFHLREFSSEFKNDLSVNLFLVNVLRHNVDQSSIYLEI